MWCAEAAGGSKRRGLSGDPFFNVFVRCAPPDTLVSSLISTWLASSTSSLYPRFLQAVLGRVSSEGLQSIELSRPHSLHDEVKQNVLLPLKNLVDPQIEVARVIKSGHEVGTHVQ